MSLRGPCDCPACQAGDEDRCFVVAMFNTLLLNEARASVALSHDPECQTISLGEEDL